MFIHYLFNSAQHSTKCIQKLFLFLLHHDKIFFLWKIGYILFSGSKLWLYLNLWFYTTIYVMYIHKEIQPKYTKFLFLFCIYILWVYIVLLYILHAFPHIFHNIHTAFPLNLFFNYSRINAYATFTLIHYICVDV